ncbi:glycosyltransferase family 4 protein [Thermococcus aciditolerans]|uniref:Glycosyltransferase family 4 protein n=1 Tax=Thermococcus aciditolerans TaxID=2598455 RepID=A0A5C0SLI9_9EURY|nr:glycosyltransferase family 4 protein [Thermococcus aciditolerans]QEK15251.1 glycosyltransferase family 4 protein [Thermococcus aciditolerans]
MLQDKKLLILAGSFPSKDGSFYIGSFIKGQVDELKNYFEEIIVISPQPVGYRRNLKEYFYDNVRVYYPRFFHIPVEFFRKRLGDNFFKAASRIIEGEGLEFDLIHAHFTWPSGYAGVKLKEKYNVPLIITTHGLHVTRLETLKKRSAICTWNSADAIINVSRKCVELLMSLGIPMSRLYYIPNGVDLGKFYPMDSSVVRKMLGIPIDKKIIVSVGNLVEKKGYIYLINAAKIMRETEKDFAVYIIGGGPLYNYLQNEIRKLGLQKHVKLIGPKPHHEIPLWMNAADVFVLPSLVENFGVVNIEAMACGKPVVSTYNGGSEEIIVSEDYGLLCPPKNPECLAEKILIALEKEWDHERIRNYAKQFTWELVVKQILDVYDKVLGDQSCLTSKFW